MVAARKQQRSSRGGAGGAVWQKEKKKKTGEYLGGRSTAAAVVVSVEKIGLGGRTRKRQTGAVVWRQVARPGTWWAAALLTEAPNKGWLAEENWSEREAPSGGVFAGCSWGRAECLMHPCLCRRRRLLSSWGQDRAGSGKRLRSRGGFLPDISPLIVGSHKNTSSQRRQFTDSQAQPLQGLEPGLRADDRLCTAALLTLLLLLLLPWIKPQHQARHTCPLTTHCIAVPGLPHPRPAASGQRTLDPVLVDHVCQSRPPRLACLCVRVVEAAEGE